MTKTQLKELHAILQGLDAKVTSIGNEVGTIKKNLKVLNSKAVVAEEQFQKINKAITNMEVVCIETQRQTRQIHQNMISTADQQGKEIRNLKLKLVPNGEPSSGGRRPARKNS